MDSSGKIRQLQGTIAALEDQRAILGDDVVKASIAALRKEIEGLRPAYTQERKLVTILFCDMVDSSWIAADRDPEEVLTIVDGALNEMAAAVHYFGGTVTRYMGDGILAVFGAPKAQERHAEQALRAGLAIQERMAGYSKRLEKDRGVANFRVRVGINSGHVVGGDVGGEQGEYTVIGEAVNIAARFEAAAPPGGVLVGASTFQLAGGERLFEADAQASITVKGSPHPQAVYLVHGALSTPRLKSAKRAPLTGRRAELAALKENYHEVRKRKKLRIVRVIGPAGIGKSRMRLEFLAWLEAVPARPRIIRGTVFAHSSSTPYALASSLLNAALNIVDADSMQQRRAKLMDTCRNLGGLSDEHLHGLAALAAVKIEDDELEALDLQARRDVIFESFIDFWQRQAGKGKVVLVLEDTHWADDLSLDLFEELALSAPGSPLLIVYFSRAVRSQESRFTLLREGLGPDAYAEILLQELDTEQTGRMVRGLLAFEEVPPALLPAIDKHAQGNPFFIEEIVKTLLEDGSLIHREKGWTLTRELAEIHVPDTVQGVLAARIDRLEAGEKEVLQHAAIIGRSFPQQVLGSLFEREIESDLEVLRERDFLIKPEKEVSMDDWEWLFRHVLVQEVAYESVLIELRRKIHGRIAAILERISGDRLDELAPTLALHCERAQIWSRAIEYLVTAAERAARVFALPEALLFYDRAVELGEAHREEMSDAALLDLYENRGDVRALAYEFDGAETDYRIVLTAARQRRDHAREQRVLVHLGFLFRNADRWEESVTCLHAAQEIAREHGHLRTVADTLYHLGTVAWTKGDNITALSHQQEAIDICRRLELDDIVTVQALHGLAEAQHWAADLHQAIQNYRESITLARQIQDKSFESENLYMLALAHSGDRGTADYQAAMSNIDEALEISRTARLVGHMTPALGVAGNIYAGFGDFQRAFAHFTEAIEWSEKLGVVRFQAATYFNMGAFYRALNLFEEAYAITELGLQISKEYQLGFMLFGLHAKLVTDGLQMGDLDVEPELLQTLELARGRGEELHIIDCLEGLARRALLAGELHAVLNYADQLLEKVRRAGMREIAAQARILRGEALTLMEDWTPAEQELRQAQQFADSSLGIRLRWDAHAALEKLYRSWGKEEQAEQELAQVRAIVSQIRDNIQDEKLKTGLPAI